eukprot:Platyproteum_vivax@DN861_c0_g1_i1.p1
MHYKLRYFDTGGKAEGIRVALHYAGADFEDIRVSFADWGEQKKNNATTTPLGQMPTLECEGSTFTQAEAILRYVGQLSTLYPEDEVEALRVDEVLQVLADAMSKLAGKGEDDEDTFKGKRAELQKELCRYFTYLETIGASSSTGFIAGTQNPSIADLSLMSFEKNIVNLDHIDPDLMIQFPSLKKSIDKCRCDPKIASYYKKNKN